MKNLPRSLASFGTPFTPTTSVIVWDGARLWLMLKVWEDWYIFIAIGHGFKLCMLEMWGKKNSSIGIDINEHELVDEVAVKICKVSKHRIEFHKVADGNQTFGSQAIRFNKHFGLLKPCEEMILIAVKFDTSNGLIA